MRLFTFLWYACVISAVGVRPLSSQQVLSMPQLPPPPDTSFTIKTQVNLVLLDVSVRDSKHGLVSGLPKESFAVFEDGKAQTVTEFAASDIPVTVGLVVDNSGSMRPKKPEVITASLVFAQASNPLDEVFVINFNDKVRRGLPPLVPFTDDPALLRQALVRTDPAGRTSLYDAIHEGLRQLEMGRRDKKTLLVVSDGGDNASSRTLQDTMREVLESRATIYTIGVFNADDPDKNPGVLQRLSNVSGGDAFFPKTLEEIAPVCRQIAKDIRTRYTIGYIPTNMDHRGVRHVKVMVTAPNHEKLTARTRSSYIIPSAVPTESADRKK